MACHAKSHLSEVGRFVARTSTEVHGGMGFTDLAGLHFWFKRIGYCGRVRMLSAVIMTSVPLAVFALQHATG